VNSTAAGWIYIDRPPSLLYGQDEWRTLLSRASEKRDERTVKLLLEKGAQPDIKDKYGRTALSWAIERGDPVIIQLLLSQTAEVDYFYTLRGVSESNCNWMDLPLLLQDEDRTPLSRASEKGDERALEKGAQPGIADTQGQTALSYAMRNGHGGCVNLLKSIPKKRRISTEDE